MTKSYLYQVRIDVSKKLSLELKNKEYSEKLKVLINNLKLQNAILVCQYDAFINFLKECEGNNQQNSVLYKWTKDTVEDKSKEEKYKKSFTVYVKNEQLYDKNIANLIVNEIKKVSIDDIINIRTIDSNPKNNPQPPKKYF